MHMNNDMEDKEDIRQEQCDYLDWAVEYYRLNLTEIARAIGVSPSTLNRFRNSNNTKHVLGSVTLNKLKKKFPLKESPQLSDADVALRDAFKVMMQIFLHSGLAAPRTFTAAFSSMEADYELLGLPNAAQIMRQLTQWVELEEGHPDKIAISKYLRLPQIGRA